MVPRNRIAADPGRGRPGGCLIGPTHISLLSPSNKIITPMSKKPTLRLTIVLGLQAIGSLLHAQGPAPADSIYLRNGHHLIGRIEEVGRDEVKYRPSNDGVLLSLEKDGMQRIPWRRDDLGTCIQNP